MCVLTVGDEGNSDGEHSSCSSDIPSPSESWREQPAFPRPIPAPLTSDHHPFSIDVAAMRSNPNLGMDLPTAANYMLGAPKMPPDSPSNGSGNSS